MGDIQAFWSQNAGSGFAILIVDADAFQHVTVAYHEGHAIRLFADMNMADARACDHT